MLKVLTAPPDPILRPFVRAYVQREMRLGDTQEMVEPVIARLGVMLEFEFAGPYEVLNYGSDAVDATFPISIIGPQTWRRARLIIRGHIESLVVLFQPCGFHGLFDAPTLPLAETGTEGHAVLGAEVSRLHQRLGNVPSFGERVRILNGFFLNRLAPAQAADPAIKAMDALTAPGPLVKVSEVARHMGVNLRQLERKSLAYAGVSPKALTRISRFSRALRLRNEGNFTWTEVAHAAGYHDHMHMIRDFRIFAGEAPTAAVEEIASDHLINFCVQ